MKTVEIPQSHFHGRGASFDEIALKNELGGAKAILSYLKTRRAMCARALANAAAYGQETHLLQEGIHSFDQAIALLTKVRVKPDPELIKAMGPRILLGLK